MRLNWNKICLGLNAMFMLLSLTSGLKAVLPEGKLTAPQGVDCPDLQVEDGRLYSEEVSRVGARQDREARALRDLGVHHRVLLQGGESCVEAGGQTVLLLRSKAAPLHPGLSPHPRAPVRD